MKQPKDGYYTVYLLPAEWYVGMTGNIKGRLSSHKHSQRDISHWTVLAEANTREEALEIETHYHSVGYNGERLIDYNQVVINTDYIARNAKIDFVGIQPKRIANTDFILKSKNTDYFSRVVKMNKPILQFSKDGELIQEFESIKMAQNEFLENGRNIGLCLRGKSKTAYGYKWEYKKI